MNTESARRDLRWPLRVRTEERDGVVIVELAGRLGHASAGALTATFGDLISGGARSVILDLSAVDYISSAGLLAVDLAAAHLDAVDGALVLCAPQGPVRVAFDLAGFLPRYAVEPSRERAVARLTGRAGPDDSHLP